MKIIITESQLNLLKKLTLTENEELNQYDLTADEMRQVEEQSEQDVKEYYESLKKEVEELRKRVKMYNDFDWSQMDVENVKVIKKQIIQPEINRLKNLEEQLSNFNFEERKKGQIYWNLTSAGGIGFAIRYKRYQDEALNRNLTKEDIIDLFVTALEGGSNYWYHMDLPEDIKSFGDSTSEAVGEYILQGGYIEFYDVEEYERVLRDKERGDYNIQGDVEDEKSFNEDLEETKLGYVDMNKILEAITIIKKEYPEIWENILLEQADAGDADVFLQICVMGEVVYG
jgi:hypothetical protein